MAEAVWGTPTYGFYLAAVLPGWLLRQRDFSDGLVRLLDAAPGTLTELCLAGRLPAE